MSKDLQLHVHAVEAADIPRSDFLGLPDLYMTLQLSTATARQSTDVIHETQNPIWNQQFHFALPDPSRAVLTAVVKNKAVLGDDTPLATLSIPLGHIAPYHVTDGRYPMQTLSGATSRPTIRIILQIAPTIQPAFQAPETHLWTVQPPPPHLQRR
jgi:Ca2+-dependent lipid-binding protein